MGAVPIHPEFARFVNFLGRQFDKPGMRAYRSGVEIRRDFPSLSPTFQPDSPVGGDGAPSKPASTAPL